jgi:hypothetical protein
MTPKPFIAACIIALFVHPIAALAEDLAGIAAWLSSFWLLLALWAYSVVRLWHVEHGVTIRFAFAIVAGAVAFGLFFPEAIIFTGWSLFGFAP